MPWGRFIEARRARDARHEDMARMVRELHLISKEARSLQTGVADHMAHVMLDAAGVFAEELSAVGKTDLVDLPSAPQPKVEGVRAQ